MYAIVDCNNFYASCEQVFNPKLEKKPLLILSNNDGIVIARSEKAKALGIPMGAKAFDYRPQIQSGAIQTLSCNFSLYADMSDRVMQVLESEVSEMEIYSIDEAFFLYRGEDAHAIRAKIKKWTGVTVSIGIAPTKTLAKLANRTAKKSKEGVFTLTDPQQKLETTPLEDIWGIGHATMLALKRKQIYTPAMLIAKSDSWIRNNFNLNLLKTTMELRGTPCLELEEAEKKQSIMVSRSFEKPIEDRQILSEHIAAFAGRAAEKLREQQSKAQFLSVFIATSPFKEPYESRSCHFNLPHGTAYTSELISLAKQGLERMHRPGFAYKRGGVILGDFVDSDTFQGDLFTPDPASEKKMAAMQVLDRINTRYDKPAIRYLAEGKEWKESGANKSPRYTTSWDDILEIQ